MVDVSLRPVEVSDLEILLAWRSNPRIYRHFREQDGPLSWEEHLDWFASRPSGRRDYVIEYAGRRVGSISLTEDGEVGIYVGELELWGSGVATVALERAIERVDDERLMADIHHENDASRRLFERCGFELAETEGDWERYTYERDV